MADWIPTEYDKNLLVRMSARLDIPLLNRRSLRDEAELLHQLANQLTRLSLDAPGETLAPRSALILAQSAIHGCQQTLREIRAADMERIEKAKLEEKVRAVPKWGIERKVS